MSATLAPPPAACASDADAACLQRRLARFNARRIAPGCPDDPLRDDDAALCRQEREFLESLRGVVSMRAAAAPVDVDGFLAWFEALERTGPGQYDTLFDWLAAAATLPQMRWFLLQEAAGEAGFDDLVALTQLRLPTRPKLEMARNYWDEMGRGRRAGMHGPMLSALIEDLGLHPQLDDTVAESLALANTLLGLAVNRRYAWHAVGALGAVELTAPSRVSRVAAGLKRLGMDTRQRRYFDLHSAIDLRHSRDWNAEVIAPLVAEDPARACWIAEGALMRLTCGARCFERYRHELWTNHVAIGG